MNDVDEHINNKQSSHLVSSDSYTDFDGWINIDHDDGTSGVNGSSNDAKSKHAVPIVDVRKARSVSDSQYLDKHFSQYNADDHDNNNNNIDPSSVSDPVMRSVGPNNHNNPPVVIGQIEQLRGFREISEPVLLPAYKQQNSPTASINSDNFRNSVWDNLTKNASTVLTIGLVSAIALGFIVTRSGKK